MKRTFLAWILFFGGLGVEMVVDRCAPALLWKAHHPTWLWYLPQMLLALGALVLAWLGTAGLRALWKRIPILLVELGVGFVAYVFLAVWYLDTYRPTPTMAFYLNQRAGGDGGQPSRFHAEGAWAAAPHHER